MTSETFFKHLRQQYHDRMPFVVYRKPALSEEQSLERNEITAFLQQDDDLYKVTDFTEKGFVFAPFEKEKTAVLIPEEDSEKLVLEQSGKRDWEKESPMAGESSGGISSAGAAKEFEEERKRHLRLVQKGIEALRAGEMDKVVLSRRETVGLQEEPLTLFQELMQNYPTAFVYCWYHPRVGLWLGATPETLLAIEGNSFKTMALAGTQKFKGTTQVEWGEKEKQEQQYVTDSILEDLGSLNLFAENQDSGGGFPIKTTEAFTTKAGSLLHLRTDISARLESKEDLGKIIRSLHPTPAVCGLPKQKAREFILREENYDREFYTGFLGELNLQQVRERSRNRRNVENLAYVAVKKQTSLYVNLRCMKIEEGKAVLFIGGGITKDSVPEDEWEETVNKAQTMKKVLVK